jgi:outer membrane protein OmpA-like peptidoglycan-associated protein
MNLKSLTSMIAAIAITLFTSVASAQSLTLRIEPGASVPLTNPQAQRFDAGGSIAVKPELGIGSYFSLGPVVQFTGLPSRINGIDAGTAWSYGGFARIKRPHDDTNTGSGWSAISPWIDADAKYVRTDGFDRFGLAGAIGAQVPTSDSRWLWVGPFARYDVLYNQDGKPGINANSAKVLTIGLSFEFGAPRKVVAHYEEPTTRKSEPPIMPMPEPKKPTSEVIEIISYTQVIQFAFDSAVISSEENKNLESVLETLLADKDLRLDIEGHASSEGQAEYNQKLSVARADAVANWFMAHGISTNSIWVIGYGSSKPIADNKTEAGRRANRRVEFGVSLTIEKK